MSMERWQSSWLGRNDFPSELTPFDLDQYFVFNATDRIIIEARRRPVHRLGIALQIGCIRLSGRTLDAIQTVPQAVLHHVAAQLHLPASDIASLRALYRRLRTRFEHQALACQCTGFGEITDGVERALNTYLRREAVYLITSERLVEVA
jgi:hypothetical protein